MLVTLVLGLELLDSSLDGKGYVVNVRLDNTVYEAIAAFCCYPAVTVNLRVRAILSTTSINSSLFDDTPFSSVMFMPVFLGHFGGLVVITP